MALVVAPTTTATLTADEPCDGYWQYPLSHDLRPSWRHLCLALDSEPMRIVGRSKIGRQILCVSNNGERLHLLMLADNGWGYVGGPLRERHPHHPTIRRDTNALGRDGLQGVMFMENDAAEPQILLWYKRPPEQGIRERTWSRVGILRTGLHTRGDPNAFRWVFDAQQNAAYIAMIQAYMAERASAIRACLSNNDPHVMATLMRADNGSPEDPLLDFLDYVPVYSKTVRRRYKLTGRPTCSADRGKRSGRSKSLRDDYEVTCIATMIMVMYTQHKELYHMWCTGSHMQALYYHTEGYAILRSTRDTHRSLVSQLRRWLVFAKLLGEFTDGFRIEATAEMARRIVAHQGRGAHSHSTAALVTAAAPAHICKGARKNWILRRTIPIAQVVRCWIKGGCLAEILFTATRPEWPTGDGCTADAWVRTHGLELQDAYTELIAHASQRVAHNSKNARPTREIEDSEVGATCLRPFLDALHNAQVAVASSVHAMSDHTTPGSRSEREMRVTIRKAEDLFHTIGQNVTTHMRSCRGIVELMRKLDILLTRVDSLTRDNSTALLTLERTCGAYSQDLASLRPLVHRAMRHITDAYRREASASAFHHSILAGDGGAHGVMQALLLQYVLPRETLK